MTNHAERSKRVIQQPAAATGASSSGLAVEPGQPIAVTGLAVPDAAEGLRRRASSLADPLGGTEAAPEVTDALKRRRGKGARMPSDLEASFGGAMQADLSKVRLHTDGEADTIARSVQATAFTQGNDVYFTKGQYAPSTPAGQHLLAHELSHVVQQQSGLDSAAGPTIGRAADPLEADADRQADRVLGALRRRAAAGAGEHAGHSSSRISRMAALVGGSIRRVLSDAAAIADAAKKIANGHSFGKHVTQQAEFTAQKITTVDEFETHISSVISSTTSKDLGGGRSAYWDDASGTIVIVNPGAADMGTCFRPTAGKSYYDKQV
ncbi:MAG: hypothetical protein QOF92_2224 [Pseudonocardiales bacterium]|jgi:hypothetical protein|nr:hypothetical protein [Pseudonocardiales bacterium]